MLSKNQQIDIDFDENLIIRYLQMRKPQKYEEHRVEMYIFKIDNIDYWFIKYKIIWLFEVENNLTK